MAIVWNAFSFMPGNWAMISALATVTTPLASVVAALAEVAKAMGLAIAAVATRPRMILRMVCVSLPLVFVGDQRAPWRATYRYSISVL